MSEPTPPELPPDPSEPQRQPPPLKTPEEWERLEPLKPYLPREPANWQGWWIGILASSFSAGILCAGIRLLFDSLSYAQKSSVTAQFVAWPSMILLPLFTGLVAAYFWRSISYGRGMLALQCLLTTIVSLAGACIFFKEGTICLIMISPIIYALVYCGALIGRLIFRRDDSKHNLHVLPLVALLMVAEPFTRSDRESIITDRLLIHAPPSRVFSQVTAFDKIPAKPDFWLFRIGMPYPEATTTAGNFEGADRRCIFSGNAVFKETVVKLVPDRELTFSIDEIPPDPELLGHMTPSRGQFLLEDNGDGTTTLVGSTWYTLHVRPLWYFDWWTAHVFRAVHMRVMEDVKRRAEAM